MLGIYELDLASQRGGDEETDRLTSLPIKSPTPKLLNEYHYVLIISIYWVPPDHHTQ